MKPYGAMEMVIKTVVAGSEPDDLRDITDNISQQIPLYYKTPLHRYLHF